MAENCPSCAPGGRSKYCCVPDCQSSFYDNQGNRTGISFFSFPLEAKLKNRWLLAIKRQEHRDRFIVTEYTVNIIFAQRKSENSCVAGKI